MLFFDFESFRRDFKDHLLNNDSEYSLDFNEVITISPYWIKFDFDKIDKITSILREILLYEFGLYSELDGTIKVPANKEKNTLDVLYNILKQRGEPMHLEEIFIEFQRILPGVSSRVLLRKKCLTTNIIFISPIWICLLKADYIIKIRN